MKFGNMGVNFGWAEVSLSRLPQRFHLNKVREGIFRDGQKKLGVQRPWDSCAVVKLKITVSVTYVAQQKTGNVVENSSRKE